MKTKDKSLDIQKLKIEEKSGRITVSNKEMTSLLSTSNSRIYSKLSKALKGRKQIFIIGQIAVGDINILEEIESW